jgi:hypothetical protein
MAVPGYDIDDLEHALEERLHEESPSALLNDEELAAYEADERLVETLDAERIETLLGLD